MHYLKGVDYDGGYALLLTFEDDSVRRVDLESHLDGEVFEPLKSLEQFSTAHLNADIDTVVWDNGADMAPDFLYDISVPVDTPPARKVAKNRSEYGADSS